MKTRNEVREIALRIIYKINIFDDANVYYDVEDLIKEEYEVENDFVNSLVNGVIEKREELTKLDKELVILMLEDYLEIKKLAEGDEELMEVAERLYELTDNIDNIGLYDPEKRRKEEEALKIEYHSNIAREQGIEQGIKTGASNEKKTIAKNLLNIGMPLKDIVKTTGLSKKQITMLM